MDFFVLRTAGASLRAGSGEVSCARASAVSRSIHTYAELRQQIHDDLRMQHPEWVQPNGESPMCDAYEARLTETLEKLIGIETV